MKKVTTLRFGDRHSPDKVTFETKSGKRKLLALAGTPLTAFIEESISGLVPYEQVVIEIGPDTEYGTTVTLSARRSYLTKPHPFFVGYATLQDPATPRAPKRRWRRLQRQH